LPTIQILLFHGYLIIEVVDPEDTSGGLLFWFINTLQPLEGWTILAADLDRLDYFARQKIKILPFVMFVK
jgi:hypothetical protein